MPQIDPANALRHKLTEISEKDRVDAILTNPPFRGEEEKGIQGNFPEDKRTAETALLFLQLIMRKLRPESSASFQLANPRQNGSKMLALPSRAAVVVRNGTLFGDGLCARIKEELLKDYNLHPIVRLPNGVFAPCTSIPTNILFFERSGPMREVWYYEQPLPKGWENYPKTAPIQFEDFTPLVEWWNKREENERAWKVPAAERIAMAATLIARIRARRKTSRTCRLHSSPRAFWKRKIKSPGSWATWASCSRSTAHELLCRYPKRFEHRPHFDNQDACKRMEHQQILGSRNDRIGFGAGRRRQRFQFFGSRRAGGRAISAAMTLRLRRWNRSMMSDTVSPRLSRFPTARNLRRQESSIRSSVVATLQKIPSFYNFTERRRRALAMTETELRLMAAPAMIGLRRRPKNG